MPISSHGVFPQVRMRRLRGSSKIRNLVRETYLDVAKLVMPIFIKHGSQVKSPIASMPGIYQLSIDNLEKEIKEIAATGIQSVLLFGIPASKDPLGQDAYSDSGIVQAAIKLIKKVMPHLTIISDICFCEYTDHGHCGIVDLPAADQEIDVNNDKTLALLAMQAVSHAKAGTDIIAPSGSMDGMVQAIRLALDAAGFQSLPILSYSVKYASAMYGPFRHAAEGAPKFGDRRTYQMDVANANEAIRECHLDIAEGADMLMVKPAHAYLDIIFRVKQTYPALPLAAYHVSGEYSMVKAAAEKGWIDEKKVVMEVLTAISRAGADFIVTYYAKEAAKWLQSN